MNFFQAKPEKRKLLLRETVPREEGMHLGGVAAFDGEHYVPTGSSFSLTPSQFAVHMAILGMPGSGKSKLMELIGRRRLLAGQPFGLWDPADDLVNNLAAFVANRKAARDDVLWQRVHILELSQESLFSYDPALHAPLRSVVGDLVYFQWLKTRADELCRIILLRVAEADQHVMNRLKRWLKNAITACLVALDGHNTHVGMDRMLTLCDPTIPEFEGLYARVAPHLPAEVAADYRKLIVTRRDLDREKWTESTVNRAREFLSPFTRAVFSQRRPSVDVRGVIERGEFLFVKLRHSRFLSKDEKFTIGGMLLLDALGVKEAEEDRPEDERTEWMFIVDEVGELLNESLKTALGANRKWKASLILGGQDLSTFARGDLEMAGKLLCCSGTVVSFANTYFEDKPVLRDRIFTPNLSFEPELVEVQRQRGFLRLMLQEVAHNYSLGASASQSLTLSEGLAHAENISNALALSEQRTDSSSEARGRAPW